MTDEAERPLRVLIGTPTGDMMYSLTALHWAGLFATSREMGIEAEPVMQMGSMPVNNRSVLGQVSLIVQPSGWTADALLLIDPDMVFPRNALAALIERGGDRDILGATYMQRCPGGWTHGFELDGSRIDVSRGGDVREVASIPCGFMLIRRRVLEALKGEGDLPFFRYPFIQGSPDSISEDYDFCRRARELGFQVWVDPELSLGLGHIGTFIYQIPRAPKAAEAE